jgi:hypothetical protein
MIDKIPFKSVDYDALAAAFNDTLVSTLRQHSAAESFLEFWVPDADPVRGIAGMVDSACIAGLDSIEIAFRQATVPAERLPELRQLLSETCVLALEHRGETVILRASSLKRGAGRATVTDVKPKYWEASAERSSLQHLVDRKWDTTELAEFGDVHPHFRPGLAAALESLKHEGDVDEPLSGLIYVSGSEGAIRLLFGIEPQSHVVRVARHFGTTRPSERAVLDIFCRLAEKLPLQEVADHTGLKVLSSLVDEDKERPVTGVLLPINAGGPFLLAPRLARRAFDIYSTQIGANKEANFYYPPAPETWRALSSNERLEKLMYVLRAFLQSEALYPDDMFVIRIQKNKYGDEVRANIGFSERVAVAAKPDLMRRLEKRMRRDLRAEIDLVADRAKDTSPLRRLS